MARSKLLLCLVALAFLDSHTHIQAQTQTHMQTRTHIRTPTPTITAFNRRARSMSTNNCKFNSDARTSCRSQRRCFCLVAQTKNFYCVRELSAAAAVAAVAAALHCFALLCFYPSHCSDQWTMVTAAAASCKCNYTGNTFKINVNCALKLSP